MLAVLPRFLSPLGFATPHRSSGIFAFFGQGAALFFLQARKKIEKNRKNFEKTP
jgi:hypothetical protein